MAQEPKYTYFQVDYVNFTHGDGDYIIFPNMDEVSKHLLELEHYLDSEPEDKDYPYSIKISPIVMTKAEYADYYTSYYYQED